MNRAFFVVTALVLSATTATAQTSKKVQFLPGGNTIAGPGARTLEALSPETVFFQSATTTMDLCGTVANVGKPGSVAQIQVFNPSLGVNALNADAGESATACQKASNVVKVICAIGPQCQVLWRVDQSR